MDSKFGRTVTSEERLREIIPQPDKLVLDKVIDHIDDNVRRFIESCPYVILSTANNMGVCDSSPRGGQPGFIRVLDDHRLLLPESTGNRRADSISNILRNPSVGMLFLIPGYEETLRINGHAVVTEDPEMLSLFAWSEKPPVIAIGITIAECYLHCGKAALRASLWNPMGWPDVMKLPSAAEILRDHTQASHGDGSAEHMERILHESYTKRL
jgi:uncharacterized protein